jgi:hypothetical protein
LNSQDGAGGAPRWAEAFESSGMLRYVAAANTPTHGVLSSGGKILHLSPLRSAWRRLPCIYHACPQDYPVGAVLLNSQDGAGGAPRWVEAFESSGMLRYVAAANTPTHGVLSSGVFHLFPLRSA